MTALLYGFRPDYVPTVALVSLIIVALAAVACFVPRAPRIARRSGSCLPE